VCNQALQASSVGLVPGDMVQSGSADESSAGTFIVLGDLDQFASQTSDNAAINTQAVSGSFIIGNTTQNNDQQVNTSQNISQSLTGTYVVFGVLNQSADQTANTTLVNQQTVGG
jgi:hypothetical protein